MACGSLRDRMENVVISQSAVTGENLLEGVARSDSLENMARFLFHFLGFIPAGVRQVRCL
jgi:hypothetical protein